jgi:hypothetical protein
MRGEDPNGARQHHDSPHRIELTERCTTGRPDRSRLVGLSGSGARSDAASFARFGYASASERGWRWDMPNPNFLSGSLPGVGRILSRSLAVRSRQQIGKVGVESIERAALDLHYQIVTAFQLACRSSSKLACRFYRISEVRGDLNRLHSATKSWPDRWAISFDSRMAQFRKSRLQVKTPAEPSPINEPLLEGNVLRDP